MDHTSSQQQPLSNRMGFHYFPDTLHFSHADVQRWLPILKNLSAQWLVVQSPIQRAVPESFIQSFSSNGINLIIDFHLSAGEPINGPEVEPLLNAYGKWGAKYILLNHTPNMKNSWKPGEWGDPLLIDHFCDQFLQFAEMSLSCGLQPIFPPLYPGGDYWDLAFLKSCSLRLQHQAPNLLLNNLTFAVYGWDFGKSLEWGAGGPAAWPDAKAYQRPSDGQNHMGFRCHEWYSAILQSVFSRAFPFILLQISLPHGRDKPLPEGYQVDLNKQDQIYRLLNYETVYTPEDPNRLARHISDEVICGNFYLLTSTDPMDQAFQWFSSDGAALPPAQAFNIKNHLSSEIPNGDKENPEHIAGGKKEFKSNRYILISEQLSDQMPVLLESLHPYLVKHKPLVGFNPIEASQAAVIIYISAEEETDNDRIQELRSNGSLVRHFHPDEIPTLIHE